MSHIVRNIKLKLNILPTHLSLGQMPRMPAATPKPSNQGECGGKVGVQSSLKFLALGTVTEISNCVYKGPWEGSPW